MTDGKYELQKALNGVLYRLGGEDALTTPARIVNRAQRRYFRIMWPETWLDRVWIHDWKEYGQV